ncbi:Casein kinase substrate, phosphoprotein PP28 [Metarhizium rileyi]|uniref:Casein kinase substrate, phosphoprotein PP28 n=1 Tax=Metarhizium rileyi (strain RCEF 4871) TaxID=1649241 RepID=A0A162JV36_METRR|nr:Casein kinase substrate, phosphoprotein PP28 [Metarhizium rileyi RCEF 4871]
MAGGSTTGPRGRAGKFNKPTRGGGKHYSRSLQPVDADGNQVSMWSAGAADENSDGQDDSEEEDSDEDSDDAGPSKTAAEVENRDDRKALKKARKEAAIAKQKSRTVEVGDLPSSDDESDDAMPANPNHSKSARDQTKNSSDVDDITEGVENLNAPGNRKEREAIEAAAAKEKYMKLQAEGKTDQAKADLARLKLIREQRAADAARRQAEKEEREEQEKARKTEVDAKESKKREAAAGPKKAGKRK